MARSSFWAVQEVWGVKQNKTKKNLKMKNRIVFWISIFAVILFGGKIGKKKLFTRLRLIKFDLQTFHN